VAYHKKQQRFISLSPRPVEGWCLYSPSLAGWHFSSFGKEKICTDTRQPSWWHWGLMVEFYPVNLDRVSRRRDRGCGKCSLRERKEKTPKNLKKVKCRRSEKHSLWWSSSERKEISGEKRSEK